MKRKNARRKLRKSAAAFAVEGIEGVAMIARVRIPTAATAVVKAIIAHMKQEQPTWSWTKAAATRRRKR
jgi:hypothetical protein